MGSLGAKSEKLEEPRLPRHKARQRPVGSNPGPKRLVGVVPGQCVEQIWLIVEESMFQVNRERQGVQHQAAGRGEIVNHLERVALIENVLSCAVIGRQAVFPARLLRHRIEVDIQGQRSEIAVDIHAVIFEAQLLVQMARRGEARSSRIDVDVELVVGRDWASESLKQAQQEPPIGAPHALRTQFDDAVDALEGSQELELPIKCKNWRTKTHFFSLDGVLEQIGIDASRMQLFSWPRRARWGGKRRAKWTLQRAGRLHEMGGKRGASARAICAGHI